MKRLVPLVIVLLALPINTRGDEKAASSGEKTFLAGAVTSNVTPQLGLPVIGGFQPFPFLHGFGLPFGAKVAQLVRVILGNALPVDFVNLLFLHLAPHFQSQRLAMRAFLIVDEVGVRFSWLGLFLNLLQVLFLGDDFLGRFPLLRDERLEDGHHILDSPV